MLQVSKEEWAAHYSRLKSLVGDLDDLLIELRWRVPEGITKKRVDAALDLSKEAGTLIRSMTF